MIARPKLAATAIGFFLLFVPAAISSKTAPDLRAKDLSGQPRRLSELRGQIVVLSFWATWCGPCQEELPRLSHLRQEYQTSNVQFVAVSIDNPKDRNKIQPFLDRNKVQMDVWVGPDSDTLGDFGLGDIVPGTVILDQRGAIIGRIMGEARDEDICSRLDWLLNGRKGPQPEARTKRY